MDKGNLDSSEDIEINGLQNNALKNDYHAQPELTGTTMSKQGILSHKGDVEACGAYQEGADQDVWDSPVEFIVSCISMSIGLANILWFPFVMLNNGGGAFLIPYLLVLFLIGGPICYLEMCIGQFSSSTQVKVWSLSPLFKGVGCGSVLASICVVSYYCSYIAQTVFYFLLSFNKVLPWSYCNEDWGDNFCTVNGTVNPDIYSVMNVELYYQFEVLPVASRIDDGIGDPDWRLSFCLLFAWVCIFLSLVKGVRVSGKVAYFTAILPFIVLLILLIRGLTLPGAVKGLKYLFNPNWKRLYDPEVWYAAVNQCLLSLSIGFGSTVMLSSHNTFRHNVYRDAWVISSIDTFTSLLASCVVFAFMGNLAEESGCQVGDGIRGGIYFAVISFPEAVAKLNWAPHLFSVLFYLMVFTLGIGSATSLAGGVIKVICDQFPLWKRWVVTLIVCVVGFFLGLIYGFVGGPYIIELVDHFGVNFLIFVMAAVEVWSIAWIYGITNLLDDIEFMSGRRPGWYLQFCWGIVVPVGLLSLFIYTLATEEKFSYDGILYPRVALALGWLLTAFALSLLPAWGLQAVLSRKFSTFSEKFREALRPTTHWGPKSPEIRREWIEFKKSRNPEQQEFRLSRPVEFCIDCTEILSNLFL